MTAAEVETLVAGRRREVERLLRRFVHTDQDAEDAAALGAEALWRHRRRVHPAMAGGWWYVVAKHEAWRIARARRDVRHCDPRLILTKRAARAHDHDELLDVLAAFELLKPDEKRAVTARGLGLSYDEICAVMGWSYTKTNRCITEGRRAARRRMAEAVSA